MQNNPSNLKIHFFSFLKQNAKEANKMIFFFTFLLKCFSDAKRNRRIHDSSPQAKSKPRTIGNQEQDLFCDLDVFKDLT
jgi:hypothetical protein